MLGAELNFDDIVITLFIYLFFSIRVEK